jgi:uncharacterized protein (DUF1330 family)
MTQCDADLSGKEHGEIPKYGEQENAGQVACRQDGSQRWCHNTTDSWLVQAYLVLDLSVNDFGGFRKYIAEIPAFIAKRSGKYIVQGVQPTTIEGEWKPERMVVIEFPEREKAEAFLTDPEIQDLFKMRHDTTTTKLVLADSCT